MASLAEEFGLSEQTLSTRINKGILLERALNTKRVPKKEIIHNGKFYSSLNELAKAFGIKRTTLCNRIRSGRSIEEAIDMC